MRMFMLGLGLVSMSVLTANVAAQTLSVGDPAPKLTVSKWVKGDKVDKLEPGQTYVVEFWATWCGPCRASIPHLTELQKKYKERVKFIGVSVWEQDQGLVEPFVKEMGDKMDYAVALDDVAKGGEDAKGKMAEGWMTAAGEGGIPTAFVVKDGKIAWIGHPMSLDEDLDKIVSGNFNIEDAASKRREAKAAQQKLIALSQKLGKHLEANEDKEALEIVEKAITDDPKLEPMLAMTKFMLLAKGEGTAASAYAKKIMTLPDFKDNENALNAIAWTIVDPDVKRDVAKRDLALALEAATRANELTKGENPAILDTLALVYFDKGDAAKALELQEKAIKLAKPEEIDPAMKDRLEQYRKAVKDAPAK